MPENILIRGKRTFLTPADKAHVDELSALQQRNIEVHKPWVYHTDVSAYFAKIEAGRSIGLFLWETVKQSLIGVINLNEPVYGGFKSAYLGYYVDAEFGAQGYMSEGLSLALDHGFSSLGFHRFEANIQPGNTASIALVKRLGFRKEGHSPKYLCINGVWCDHERWAIVAEDWTEFLK